MRSWGVTLSCFHFKNEAALVDNAGLEAKEGLEPSTLNFKVDALPLGYLACMHHPLGCSLIALIIYILPGKVKGKIYSFYKSMFISTLYSTNITRI